MLAGRSIAPVRVGPGVRGVLGYQTRSGVSARGVPERETVITPRRLRVAWGRGPGQRGPKAGAQPRVPEPLAGPRCGLVG